jgi:hypothetical protein
MKTMTHDKLFQLRVKTRTDRAPIIITAFDANRTDPNTGHIFIDVEVKQAGDTIFKRGDTYCAVSRWMSIDGIEAKELVLSLVAMQPGDTDSEFFANYSERQLEWARENGEALDCEREFRYCDENGNVRSKKR